MDIHTFIIVAISFTAITSALSLSDECNKLYTDALRVRDNLLNNPDFGVLGELYREVTEKHLRDNVGVSIDDDEEMHDLACRLVASTNVSDIAEILGVEENNIRYFLEGLESEYDQLQDVLREIKEVAPKIQKWLQKSGFPDIWPLKTSYDENKNILRKLGFEYANLFITFHGRTDLGPYKKAKILSDATSLDDYLTKMRLDYLLGNPDYLQQTLALPTMFSTRKGVSTFTKGSESVLDFLATVIEVILPNTE